MKRPLTLTLLSLMLAGVLLACSPRRADPTERADAIMTPTSPPTPSAEALHISGSAPTGERLQVTLPSIKLLRADNTQRIQLFALLTGDQGSYSYLLYPANRSGIEDEQFDLTRFPLEIGLRPTTDRATLWIVIVRNQRYQAAEVFGLDALASSLAIGFRNWQAEGDAADDPLAAVVSASDGALYEWFASVEVLGQAALEFHPDENWNVGLNSARSTTGNVSLVYTVQHTALEEAERVPTPALPQTEYPGYTLRVDETFEDEDARLTWYEAQDDTYANRIADGAYEIALMQIEQRNYGLSWGSIQDARFQDFIIEAQVALVEEDVTDARYGVWFNYQDDYNFIYVGLSNEGQYRVTVNQRGSRPREVQSWTSSPAINRGAATNVLTIAAGSDSTYALAVNDQHLMTFREDAFNGGSVAFFCYARSVPATCRLERLRIWERTD
ncbi:MAG: hypothetical protein GXY36_18490 [Chloroflexi bacterium]|nr:hypothetical protein [Chloroflexota bacterium]